jgi:hypothetical protein
MFLLVRFDLFVHRDIESDYQFYFRGAAAAYIPLRTLTTIEMMIE